MCAVSASSTASSEKAARWRSTPCTTTVACVTSRRRPTRWWSSAATPHSPKSAASAFEKIVFGSDVFDGDLAELDRALDRYHRMLDECQVPQEAQQNIFAGTMWRILNPAK